MQLPVEGPTVRTSYGILRGVTGRGCVVFRGVPYADPPVRFKRPSPPQPWSGICDCTKYGKQAVQVILEERIRPKALGKAVLRRVTGLWKGMPDPLSPYVSEDCLYLNITSPSLSGSAPVLVWIHGGGFLFGAGSEVIYRGTKLTKSQNVVVVTINYRLGGFGFLNVPGADSNCGSWDQLQALRWIYSEIAAFGGDPQNITIFGESAAVCCWPLRWPDRSFTVRY